MPAVSQDTAAFTQPLPQKVEDWQALTAKLLSKAQGDAKLLARLLQQTLPRLVVDLQKSAQAKALLSLWGKSRNYDAEGKPLVEPVVLQALGHLTGIPLDLQHPHAGFQHTYGYLLSLPGSQGQKAERWFRMATCLSPDFSPLPSLGTLLLNLSIFFQMSLPFLAQQRRKGSGVLQPPFAAIAQLSANSQLHWQILEEVLFNGQRLRQVFLPCFQGELACYSYWYLQQRRWRLVTVFVVDQAFVARWQKVELGSRKAPVEIRLRNNIYLENQPEVQLGWRIWRQT